MPGFARVVTESLNELEILAGAGAGDLQVHATTLTVNGTLSNIGIENTNVPLHDFFRNPPETRMAAWGSCQKTLFLAWNCRTRGAGFQRATDTATITGLAFIRFGRRCMVKMNYFFVHVAK